MRHTIILFLTLCLTGALAGADAITEYLSSNREVWIFDRPEANPADGGQMVSLMLRSDHTYQFTNAMNTVAGFMSRGMWTIVADRFVLKGDWQPINAISQLMRMRMVASVVPQTAIKEQRCVGWICIHEMVKIE